MAVVVQYRRRKHVNMPCACANFSFQASVKLELCVFFLNLLRKFLNACTLDLNFYDTRKKESPETECESDPYRPVATGSVLYRTLGQRESSHPDMIWWVCVCVFVFVFYGHRRKCYRESCAEFSSCTAGSACSKYEFVRNKQNGLMQLFFTIYLCCGDMSDCEDEDRML